MPTNRLRAALALSLGLAALGLPACDLLDLEDRPHPDGPSLEGVLANPSRDVLSNLAVGVQGAARLGMYLYLVDVGVLGREYWVVNGAEPRFTADLLGKGSTQLDDLFVGWPWAARYRTIRMANTLRLGVELNPALSDAERAGAHGFALTWIGYLHLLKLNLTYENGIRFIAPGEEVAGPLVGYQESLARIAALLDEGAAALDDAGDAFFFPVSDGLAGFDTPATFREVNRALAARVALYRGRHDEALALLEGSFLDPGGSPVTGAYHVYSTGAGDFLNPIYVPPNNPVNDAILAHPSYVADLEPGDARISKVFDRGAPATYDGLTSQYGFWVYKSVVDPVSIIRNGELLLIRAEARARAGNLAGAVADLDVIRNAAGLAGYAGALTEAAVLDEVLHQRRYELYGEGHRWVDVRRFGRLDTLPIDRPGDDVWVMFPIPHTEQAQPLIQP